ncbi:MAG: hypothetical protein V9E95_16225, partial [Methanothrix soehngenii]
MDELFHDYFEKGMTAEEIEGREMIREVRRQNFIPEDIEDLYEEALIKEYERYFESEEEIKKMVREHLTGQRDMADSYPRSFVRRGKCLEMRFLAECSLSD